MLTQMEPVKKRDTDDNLITQILNNLAKAESQSNTIVDLLYNVLSKLVYTRPRDTSIKEKPEEELNLPELQKRILHEIIKNNEESVGILEELLKEYEY